MDAFATPSMLSLVIDADHSAARKSMEIGLLDRLVRERRRANVDVLAPLYPTEVLSLALWRRSKR